MCGEWRSSKLGDLADVRKGKIGRVLDVTTQGGLPYLGASALEGGPSLLADPQRAVLANDNDVLMLWDGERSGLVGRGSGVVSSTVARLRPRGLVCGEFLFHALNLRFSWIQGRRTGTGVPHVPKDLPNILFVDYPVGLGEQCRIAEILNTINEAIRETEQVIAKLKRMKYGLLCDLLTQGIDDDGALRDPQLNPTAFKETGLGWLPKRWDVLPVSALLAPVDPAMRSGPFGSALRSEELVDAGVPLLGIDNVHVERFVRKFSRFVSPSKAVGLSRYRVRPQDVMITIMGTVGRTAIVPEDIGVALSSKHVWTLSFDLDRYSPLLACWQFNYSPWVLRHFRREEQGGIMSAIRSDTLRTTLLPVPPPGEQKQIEVGLRQFNARLECEARTANKLRALRLGLMEDLLSGRVRVPVVEEVPA